MAIQNFLSGGYYGKLGATVGQRWKNKRTIRTYVKPANPRTEIQQANRNKFANAVTFAQMGLQMNYYATVFDDPNFTHWNYRMKVARELRNQGLSGLDLIPLYPTSFVPPTLIQSIEISTVQGQNHITFAVENLNGDTDRVLSLMFALYNESDVFLGYKLYLGYYYASNPGFLEVDVDNVSEINTHCFVRAITNDDVDSTTDMIASPNLAVGQSGPEVRDFNTAISEVQKTSAGIKVIFAELWKGTPTVNAITITANFVSNGATATATATDATLENENGYCSILIPFVTSDNQHLPAFPSGSSFVIASVDYEGSTWQYTKTNDTVSYSDTDLTRTINASPTWNASSTSDIAFTVAFGGTVSSGSQSMQMVCSGRLGLRTEVDQAFNYVGNGSNLTFTCVGNLKNCPMSTSGDKITLPAMQFVCNGVTYNLASQDVNLRNAITTSYFLETLSWSYNRDGGLPPLYPMVNLSMIATLSNFTRTDIYENFDDFLYIEIDSTPTYCMPSYNEVYSETSGSDTQLTLLSYFEDSEHADEVETVDAVRYTAPSIVIDGITYTFSSDWLASNIPSTVGGFEQA